jgi:hypothetical protein
MTSSKRLAMAFSVLVVRLVLTLGSKPMHESMQYDKDRQHHMIG